MRNMAGSGWTSMLTVLLSLTVFVACDHSGEIETFHVSDGHFLLLKCYTADADVQVVWSRGESEDLSLPTGVEVKDGLLWFLPVQMSHNGAYTCEKRNQTGELLLRIKFWVSVSSGECPDPSEARFFSNGASGIIPCKQKEIFGLNSTVNVQWMKDCQPIERQGEAISVDAEGNMILPAASEGDNGKYTCLADINLGGRNYTAARSIQLTVKDNITIFVEPELVTPQENVKIVQVGMRVELKCLAYIGFSEDNEISVYWTVAGMYVEDIMGLSESSKYIHDTGKVYILSTLTIPKVLHEFLNVQFECHLSSPAGEKSSFMWLQKADHSTFYMSVALCLSATLAILALVAFFFFFKVDLILAYRKILSHFPKQQVPDGKLYDAYVSFLHPNTMNSDEVESFAMQILPEKLEEQYGYSLFIRGRDDCPGEAEHDVIAATMHQCHRLIIILTTEGKTAETSPLCENHNQLWYEQKVGLYDALTNNDPRVILVEIGGPVDYSQLPESLRYIKRKQGALKWKKVSPGTHKLTKLHLNSKFWKHLRYHMPPVPARGFQTTV